MLCYPVDSQPLTLKLEPGWYLTLGRHILEGLWVVSPHEWSELERGLLCRPRPLCQPAEPGPYHVGLVSSPCRSVPAEPDKWSGRGDHIAVNSLLSDEDFPLPDLQGAHSL